MYKDPLHIHPDVYSVFYNNDYAYTLSKSLLDKQNAWGNLEKIIEAHQLKLCIYDLLYYTSDRKMLKSLALDLQEVEFELQALWGFEKDVKFHRFWEYPKCECPRLDNMDAYPHLQYINNNCPLHGNQKF